MKVGYGGKRIKLGSSKDDLVTLAQMYNIGASFFFGEYAGALNNVPEPSDKLIKACERFRCVRRSHEYESEHAADAD